MPKEWWVGNSKIHNFMSVLNYFCLLAKRHYSWHLSFVNLGIQVCAFLVIILVSCVVADERPKDNIKKDLDDVDNVRDSRCKIRVLYVFRIIVVLFWTILYQRYFFIVWFFFSVSIFQVVKFTVSIKVKYYCLRNKRHFL